MNSNKFKVKLITGLISSGEREISKARILLEKRFGKIDLSSSLMPFIHTNYYEKELGRDLLRLFLSFERLIDRENLYTIKLKSGILEKKLSSGLKRRVNIDPGYLTLGNLVLFTTKNYSHRVYLSKGIYAEVTLKFEADSFAPWPWTYPDYKTKEYIDFFNRVREIYKSQLTHKLTRRTPYAVRNTNI